MNKKLSCGISYSLLLFFVLNLCGCDFVKSNKPKESDYINESTFDYGSIREGWLDLKELVVLRPSSGSVPKNMELQEQIIGEINKILLSKINTEIKVEYVTYQKQVTETYERLFSGDNVDIIDTIPVQSELQKYAEESIIADVTDRLPTYYPEIFSDYIDFSNLYINDRIYVMPKITLRAYQDRVCLIASREMLEKAGNPRIETVEDIVNLYEFGLENVNSRGKKFIDGSRGQVFAFEFHTLLQLLCQENGYQMSNRLLAFKDGNISLLEDTHLLKEWYEITKGMCEKKGVDDNNPTMFYREQNMAMGLIYYNSIRGWNWPEYLNQVYQVMFIGDYEPYSQKILQPMALIYNNENVDRSMMALRLLYEDEQLNRLIQYGILDKHHKLKNNRVELITDSQNRNINNWWSSLINDKHSYSKVHEPEGAETYVADLFRTPKQVIPGVTNYFMAGATEVINMDHDAKQALKQREMLVFNDLQKFTTLFLKGLPYEVFIEDSLDPDLQKAFLVVVQQYVNELKNE